jgi:hypothetical protein
VKALTTYMDAIWWPQLWERLVHVQGEVKALQEARVNKPLLWRCHVADTAERIKPLQVKGISEVVLARWCHRIGLDMLTGHGGAIGRVAAALDPLAVNFGMDRLVWARTGETGLPKEQASHRRELAERMKKHVRTEQPSLASMRGYMDSVYANRTGLPDAFAGRAYCEILPLSTTSRPVPVQPVWSTEGRTMPWAASPGTVHTSAPAFDITGFTSSQAYRISKYAQLRMHWFAQLRSDAQ